MVVIERLIQKIHPGKFAELAEIDEKYNVLEADFGFPPKKRLQCVAGGHAFNTLIVERQWESLAKMEAVYEKALANQDYQKLNQESIAVIESTQMELYTPLS